MAVRNECLYVRRNSAFPTVTDVIGEYTYEIYHGDMPICVRGVWVLFIYILLTIFYGHLGAISM